MEEMHTNLTVMIGSNYQPTVLETTIALAQVADSTFGGFSQTYEIIPCRAHRSNAQYGNTSSTEIQADGKPRYHW